MKKLFILLSLFVFVISCATAQIPVEQLKKAPTGGRYCFESDPLSGKWQVVPCSTGGGGSSVSITIGTGDPNGNPNGGPIVYVDGTNGTVWTWNSQTNQWQQIGSVNARNGLVLDNGYAELGGQIIKNTIIEDASDSYDLLFKKGNASFGYEESDYFGFQSWNVTEATENDTVIAKIGSGHFRTKANHKDGYYSDLILTPNVFSLSKQTSTGENFEMYQWASGFGISLSNPGTEDFSNIAYAGAGNLQLLAKSGTNESSIVVNGGIEFKTPKVKDNNVVAGMLVESINQFGDIEFTDEVSSDLILTPPTDYDGNGVSSSNLTESLGDIYNALQNQVTNTDNQLLNWDANTAQISITGGNSVTLPINSIGGDNWGTQTVVTDNTLSGLGTGSSPLSVASMTTRYDYRVGPSTHDGAQISASSPNVTYTRIGNKPKITIPAGTILYSLDVFGTFNNLGNEDHYFIELDYQGVSFNQDYLSSRPALFALIRTYQDNRMNPTESNYWQSSLNSPPYVYNEITQVGNGLIQVKCPNVRSAGTTNFILSALKLCQ